MSAEATRTQGSIITEFLEATGDPTLREPISEQEFVQAAIDFANAAEFRQWLLVWSRDRLGDAPLIEPGYEEIVRRDVEEDTKTERARLIADFEMIISGAQLDLAKRVTKEGSRMAMRPYLDLERGALEVRYSYHPENLASQLSYVVALFLDRNRSYGSDLCRCQLESCRKFFFAKRPATGRPRRNYCSPAHMLEAHAAGSSKRVKKSRKKRRQATKRHADLS